MRTWMTARDLLDTIEEETACKSGILLTDNDVRAFLRGTAMLPWLKLLDRPPDSVMGVRPEFVEDFVRVLRVAVGDLPDATPSHVLIGNAVINTFGEQKSLFLVPEILFFLDEVVRSRGSTRTTLVNGLISQYHISQRAAREIVSAYCEWDNRRISFLPSTEEWDGALPLSQLFQGEHVPSDPEQYLDQRFIDFLATHGEEIGKIHWRNFERLVAEFFKRKKYIVALGRGSKDGGVDVRVWPASSSRNGPPLLLIQSKRYGKGKVVGIEWVKALWADVRFEQAEGGLLATTARVSPAGKRLSHARKLPLRFAENKKVRKWARSMWRHAYRPKRRTEGVGAYLLPPVYVLPPSVKLEDVLARRL